jgi:hypothetical protein
MKRKPPTPTPTAVAAFLRALRPHGATRRPTLALERTPGVQAVRRKRGQP